MHGYLILGIEFNFKQTGSEYKRPGATSDNGFKSKIKKIKIKKRKKIPWAVLEGCTNRAWPIQPIG